MTGDPQEGTDAGWTTARRAPVWHRVAELIEDRKHRVTLTYTEAAIERWGTGARPLSLSIPIGHRPIVGDNGAQAFIEGLLPEGSLRMQTADLYGVPSDDSLALLEIIGGECAGAVSVVSAGHPPATGHAEVMPIEDVDISRRHTSSSRGAYIRTCRVLDRRLPH